MVKGGIVLTGIGAAFSKRDASVLLGLRREKGFWTCFLMPTLIVLDALITYASIRSYGLYIETNSVIISLYQTGPWAVLSFHLVTVALVAGLSLFMYNLLVRNRLPKTSKLVVSTLFSTIFGTMSFLVLFSAFGLLRGLTANVYVGFFLTVVPPILLSSILATYLSTIIPEEGPRLSKHIELAT